MRYWKKAIKGGLTYNEAKELMLAEKGKGFATRPEWQGFHYIGIDGKHRILFKDGHYEIVAEEEVWGKDQQDWMMVTIKPLAYQLLKELPQSGVV